MKPQRIHMAEADASPGSGTPPPASTPPASAPAAPANVPQAQGAALQTTKEFSDAVAAEVAKVLPALKDSIFAEARRTFTEKRKPSTSDPANPPAPAPALDAVDERRILRDFDRALTKLKLTDSISTSQWSRAEKALLAEKPENVAEWAQDYFQGYAVAPPAEQKTAPQTQVTPPPRPQNDHPVTDRGSPPPPKTPLDEADLYAMSDSDRLALIKEKGPVWFRNKLHEQSRGRTIRFDG